MPVIAGLAGPTSNAGLPACLPACLPEDRSIDKQNASIRIPWSAIEQMKNLHLNKIACVGDPGRRLFLFTRF